MTTIELPPTDRELRRHALVERMLADVVGLPWETVHHEADRWGDEVSDEVVAHLTALLGDPGTCPHGNPIPGSANVPDQSAAVPLAAVTEGPVRVVRITEAVESDDATMRQLAHAGFIPGAECEVTGHDPDGGVHVAGSRSDTVVAAATAAAVYVERL